MKTSKGFSLIELLIVVAIILVICAISIPNLLRSRMSAQESAAAATVRNIHNSEATYLVEYATTGYADSLLKLGPGSTCDATHACLIDDVLACTTQPCLKSGYEYFLGTADSTAPFSTYVITATPRAWATTGSQNYCGIEDGVLRHQTTASSSLAAGLTHKECADRSQYPAISN
ncbi:MAG TPA: prepilin-type N-terminal cleavage/methylation domain-containing protein [Candidatus Angelobacter sp.]|nr:prepilin-type N-terminal cleavage/methylation domain-containing protein [Candidatus Angelobacter sp.]